MRVETSEDSEFIHAWSVRGGVIRIEERRF